MNRRHPAIPALALAALGLTAVGCSHRPTPRVTHAPTYSYLQDAEALAEIDLWPVTPLADTPLISPAPQLAERINNTASADTP
ncbi:MAG: hypothetical protein AAF800_04415 [Planctomycetota bacterium]